MKKIVKIQSQSDIITNSSSEVFIMSAVSAMSICENYPDDGGCIRFNVIDEDYIDNCYFWDIEDLCEAAGCNSRNKDGKEMFEMSEKEQKEFLNEIKPKLLEFFGNSGEYAYVDIEDHFSECEDAYDEAHSACIWSDYRH